MIRRRLFAVAVAAGLGFALTFNPAAAQDGKPITGAKPVSPQPAADKVAPGLSVIYFTNMFNKLREVGALGKGKPGEPIKILDHKTNDGNVLTADRPMGVGAKITGMIKFDAPGTYVFKVNSNDGVRLTIAGIKAYELDGVHADEMSDPIPFVVEQPGWYALDIDYFQKKGTSALQLFWTPPGGAEAIVPASQYAHLKQ
ncbi:MAG: hypothetical protein JNM30_16465 [Rhodospirillales bacterium]|nr:hypothetical protein [Rhodospirillales bacterium]